MPGSPNAVAELFKSIMLALHPAVEVQEYDIKRMSSALHKIKRLKNAWEVLPEAKQKNLESHINKAVASIISLPHRRVWEGKPPLECLRVVEKTVQRFVASEGKILETDAELIHDVCAYCEAMWIEFRHLERRFTIPRR